MSDSQGSGRTTALKPKRGKAKATERLSAEAIRVLTREELAAVRIETQPIPASSNPLRSHYKLTQVSGQPSGYDIP